MSRSENRRGGQIFWGVLLLVLLGSLAGAVVHLHGRLANISRRLDSMEGLLEGSRAGGDPTSAESVSGSVGDRDVALMGLRGLSIRLERLESRIDQMVGAGKRRSGGSVGRETDPRMNAAGRLPRDFVEAMASDGKRYGAGQLNEIDDLYRRGTEGVDSEDGRAALEELVEKFPESNRGGCAAANLGAHHLNNGDLESAADVLRGVIDLDSAAVFGNGEKVMPRALYNYGRVLERQGDSDGARAIWHRLRDDHAGDRDARGDSYGDLARGKL